MTPPPGTLAGKQNSYATDRANPALGVAAEVIAVSTSDELRDALADLFVASAMAVASRLAALNMQATVHSPRIVVRRRPDGWSMDRLDEPRNVLTDWGTVWDGSPWLANAEIRQIKLCATMLAEQFATTLPFNAAPGGRTWPLIESHGGEAPEPPEYERDPQDWVVRMLIHPALHYHLARLPCVDHADPATARAFADDVLKVAQATKLGYLSSVPLSGLDLEPAEVDMLAEGDVSLRRLSDVEQGDWANDNSENRLWRVEGFTDPPHVLLELRSSGSRLDWYSPSRDRAALFVASFHLHGHAVAGTIVAETSNPSWVLSSRHSGPLNLPRQCAKPTAITAEGFRAVVATARLLDSYDIREPSSPKDLALLRFAIGVARQSHTDALLDFTIALEALLLPYDTAAKRGELGYRFRVHGAHYLTTAAADRAATFKRLGDIYEMRGRLVHGGKYPVGGTVRAIRESAHEFARRGLLRAVHDGFPTAAMFNGMVLGSDIGDK